MTPGRWPPRPRCPTCPMSRPPTCRAQGWAARKQAHPRKGRAPPPASPACLGPGLTCIFGLILPVFVVSGGRSICNSGKREHAGVGPPTGKCPAPTPRGLPPPPGSVEPPTGRAGAPSRSTSYPRPPRPATCGAAGAPPRHRRPRSRLSRARGHSPVTRTLKWQRTRWVSRCRQL